MVAWRASFSTSSTRASGGTLSRTRGTVGLIRHLAPFHLERNETLMESDVGLGEYYYLYTLAYYSWLGFGSRLPIATTAIVVMTNPPAATHPLAETEESTPAPDAGPRSTGSKSAKPRCTRAGSGRERGCVSSTACSRRFRTFRSRP